MFRLKDAALLERSPRLFRERHAGNESHIDVSSGNLNGFAGDSSTCAIATMALKQPQARGLNHAAEMALCVLAYI